MTAGTGLLAIIVAGVTVSPVEAAQTEVEAARGRGDELDPDAWWRALFPEPWAAGFDVASSGRRQVAPGDVRYVESRLFVHRLFIPSPSWGGRLRVTAARTELSAGDDLPVPARLSSVAR